MGLAVGVGLAVDVGLGLGEVVGVGVGGRNVGEDVEVMVAGLAVDRSDWAVGVAHPARKPAPTVNMVRMKARLEKACAASIDIAAGLVIVCPYLSWVNSQKQDQQMY